jgi:hypothetical protein
MRKAFLAASALAALTALAGCGDRGGSSAGSGAPVAVEAAPPATPTPEPRPATEASAVSGGAYGMPRSPVPYDQLTAYEQQQAQANGRRAEPGPYPEQQPTAKTRRDADAVFY